MVRLLLIRHGEFDSQFQNRYIGQTDPGLSELGQKQILALRKQLDPFNVESIYSSDLTRCRETATLIAPEREIIFVPQLREMNFGQWEGRTTAECERISPEDFQRWMQDPTSIAPPGGESLTELARRVRGFVASIDERHPGRSVALITHAGPIRVLINKDLHAFWHGSVVVGEMIDHFWRRDEAA
jgi:broad specificity phosphatase PhoE